ncbi:MAG: hypothetical protein ACE5IK_14510 [Acidobacteriota bacterium]
MRGGRGWPGWVRLTGVFSVLVALGTPAVAGKHATATVQVRLPVEPKVDLTGVRRVLVGGFLGVSDVPFNARAEVVKLLRTLLARNTDLAVLTDPPASLPEQTLDELKTNAPFFQAIAKDYRADLIVSGRLQYGSVDRSGFVQQEYISPTTGRRSSRTRYVERTGYSLKLDLILVRGATGEMIYDVSFFQDDIYPADEADALQAFYDLADGFREGYLSLFIARERTETRYLFTE